MNILKKTIAPITEKGWKEIIDQTGKIFRIYLSAREFIDIDGPNGLEQGGISTGRLIIQEKNNGSGLNYGIREVLPLIEVRRPFTLDILELDNFNRGAKKVDLSALEEAAKEIALFEEKAVYSGFTEGQINGLENSFTGTRNVAPEDHDGFLRMLADQVTGFRKDGVDGPYTLVLNGRKWQDLVNLSKGYPVMKQIEQIIKGQILVSYAADNSIFLVSERGGDFELTLGQDISIGYEEHNSEAVKLYFTESFTFRVISPEAIRIMSLQNL
jgi:uncharacterized linocin/CFP29 family protein